MDNQTAREQFVVDTFKRLNMNYTARIHAEGPGPVSVVVGTPAGATVSYPVNVIGDRYSLFPQADADAATLEQLQQDGLSLPPPDGNIDATAKREKELAAHGKGKG